ncbi:MAG: GNAT family N-acetyltransferase [Treponema sp.]|jgi:ribosomal protein S18 acetylase RimI-like enzyme|nr:GNAT family N-acetyltransferase [Treponema sp.]
MDIKPMTAGNLDDAVSLLTTSFQDRPFYTYIAPNPAERRSFLIANFNQRITQGLGVNEIDLALIDGKLVGIAVWLPPPAAHEADAISHTAADHALEELLRAYSTGVQERFLAFIKTLIQAREQTIQQPFWSLAPIAVLPTARGKGVASALITKKLKEIDESSLPCFLATQDKENIAIYEKFAFQVQRKDPVSSIITHYTMIRPANR